MLVNGRVLESAGAVYDVAAHDVLVVLSKPLDIDILVLYVSVVVQWIQVLCIQGKLMSLRMVPLFLVEGRGHLEMLVVLVSR